MANIELKLEKEILKTLKIKLNDNMVLYHGDFETRTTVAPIGGKEYTRYDTVQRWQISVNDMDDFFQGMVEASVDYVTRMKCVNSNMKNFDIDISELSHTQRTLLFNILLHDHDCEHVFGEYTTMSKIDNFKKYFNEYVKHERVNNGTSFYYIMPRKEEDYINSLDIEDTEILELIKDTYIEQRLYKHFNKGLDFVNKSVVNLVKEHGIDLVKEEYLKLSSDVMAKNFAILFSIIYDIKFDKSDYILKMGYDGMLWDIDLLLSADPGYFQQVYDKLGKYKVFFTDKISVKETLELLTLMTDYDYIKDSWYGNYNNDYRGSVSSFELSFSNLFDYHYDNNNLEVCKILLTKFKSVQELIERSKDKTKFAKVLPIVPKGQILKIGDKTLKVSNANYVTYKSYLISGDVNGVNGEIELEINEKELSKML